jgi:hypothetical protein
MKVPRYDRMLRARSAFMGRPWTPTITFGTGLDYEEGMFKSAGRHGSYTRVGNVVTVTTGPMMLLREKRADQARWRRHGR